MNSNNLALSERELNKPTVAKRMKRYSREQLLEIIYFGDAYSYSKEAAKTELLNRKSCH